MPDCTQQPQQLIAERTDDEHTKASAAVYGHSNHAMLPDLKGIGFLRFSTFHS